MIFLPAHEEGSRSNEFRIKNVGKGSPADTAVFIKNNVGGFYMPQLILTLGYP
jgi:hypothetical protein